MNIILYGELIMCMLIKFYKLDIHTQFYFLLKLKMACLNFCFGANTPIPPKKPSVISVPQISLITSYGLVGFKLIQNFFRLMESSEERSLLKQRNRLLPMGKRWTRAAFTLCDTLDFCRAIKNWRCSLELKLPFFSCKLKVCPEVSHRPGYASIQGCVSW